MNKITRKIINHLTGRPKVLFLIDSVGALLTAFFLFVVMQVFNDYFGMPRTILTYLSAVAICFCIYSTACFTFLEKRFTPFMRIIGIANLLYSVCTFSLVINYYPMLTKTAITYLLLEIAILCSLSYLELTVAKELKKNNS
ncbi:MAG: hypothetical protein V4638_00110 [Bacteroidota bacterium]